MRRGALHQDLSRGRVFFGNGAFRSAKDQLDIVGDVAPTDRDKRGLVRSKTIVEGDIVTESVASYRVHVHPDMVRVFGVNGIGEVEFILADHNTRRHCGNLDGYARVLGSALMKWFGVLSATTLDALILSISVGVRDGVDVDFLIAEVGDDSLGVGDGGKGTKGENGMANHDDEPQSMVESGINIEEQCTTIDGLLMGG
jgi:hypothetical protein